jgi:hypothetical protein
LTKSGDVKVKCADIDERFVTEQVRVLLGDCIGLLKTELLTVAKQPRCLRRISLVFEEIETALNQEFGLRWF